MDLMEIRRRLMMGMAQDDWAIVLRPIGDEKVIPCISFNVTVGQRLTVAWKADAAYNNRYFMRTLTATLDNGGSYQIFTPSAYGASGENTYTVTTTGSILFAGYTMGIGSTCLIGDYVKVKIEYPIE